MGPFGDLHAAHVSGICTALVQAVLPDRGFLNTLLAVLSWIFPYSISGFVMQKPRIFSACAGQQLDV